MIIEIGQKAPDFELKGFHNGDVDMYRLSDFPDSGWVLLTFYAFDFNPICTEGMCSLRDTEFLWFEGELTLLGVSGDGIYSHEQFATEHNINYPLLSDTNKEVAEQYGVVRKEYDGMKEVHQRTVLLIDDEQVVRFVAAVSADSPEDIDLSSVVEALREMRTLG